MSILDKTLDKTIRDALLNHVNRSDTFDELVLKLNVPRDTVKRLVFAWLWHAPEQRLQSILKLEG